MTASAVIVDLGLGNLRSVARAVERAGGRPQVTDRPEDVRAADRLVVPGQGAFGACMRALDQGLGEALQQAVHRGVPYLGICLGMQALFASSDEAPGVAGLGWLGGAVRAFGPELRDPMSAARLKVPHVGWNEVVGEHPLLPARGWFYFLHGYYCVPEDSRVQVARTDYGGPVCAAVARDNVFACQFHPEKSHVEGERLMSRFLGRWS
jgi:glutamine amidotransferase